MNFENPLYFCVRIQVLWAKWIYIVQTLYLYFPIPWYSNIPIHMVAKAFMTFKVVWATLVFHFPFILFIVVLLYLLNALSIASFSFLSRYILKHFHNYSQNLWFLPHKLWPIMSPVFSLHDPCSTKADCGGSSA